MLFKKLTTIVCFAGLSFSGLAQNILPSLEDSIVKYRELSINAQNDSLKLFYNDEIVGFFKKALEQEAALVYEFSKLKRFSFIKSEDLAVVTWNLELSDFNNDYFGVIGYREKREPKSKVLIDRGLSEADEKAIFKPGEWPGALYYEIVPFKRKNGESFLLLGWRGDNRMESYKVADIISITKAGVNFGLPVLVNNDGDRLNRKVVHYPSNLSYSMKYDEKEKQFYYNRLGLIYESKGNIFNNLTPTYTFDAYQYKGGKWVKKEKIYVVKPE